MKTLYQKTGEYHIRNKIENQDAVLHSQSATAEIIVIADGVSSCKNSRQGAETACKAVRDIMLNETEYIFSSSKEKIAGLLTAYVYKRLMAQAEESGNAVETYSSTLAFVCFNKISSDIMTFVLGDSLIYSVRKGKIALCCDVEIFDEGRTYTTTTAGVAGVVDVNILPFPEDTEFILASDGAWKTFYANGELSGQLTKAVENDDIIGFLEMQQCEDDCSIVMMKTPKGV